MAQTKIVFCYVLIIMIVCTFTSNFVCAMNAENIQNTDDQEDYDPCFRMWLCLAVAAKIGCLESLEFAIECAQWDGVECLIMQQRNCGNGNTPLHWAAKEGHFEIVQALLDYVCLENRRSLLPMQNYDGKTAIDLAKMGKSQNHYDIVTFLENIIFE